MNDKSSAKEGGSGTTTDCCAQADLYTARRLLPGLRPGLSTIPAGHLKSVAILVDAPGRDEQQPGLCRHGTGRQSERFRSDNKLSSLEPVERACAHGLQRTARLITR